MAFNIERVPNQTAKPAILLRQAWREGHRIRKKTIANLSQLPPEIIDGFRTVLKGGVAVQTVEELLQIERSLPHGAVVAVLGTARHLGFQRLLHRQASRQRQLALATIIARVLDPDSKLATARQLSPQTATSSLGALLDLGPVHGNELLAMLDWLRSRQPWIERTLARRHLRDATLLLYDVSSSYGEGRCCPLAACGPNRDGKQGKRQFVFGLLCNSSGCPIAVEVFPGNPADPSRVAAQVRQLQARFQIARIALVGDRGMLTTARIRDDLQPAGLAWISALKATDLRKLARSSALLPDQLVPDAVAEISSPDFPDERLLVCLNPRLRQERRRQREDLLQATIRPLEQVALEVREGRLSGAARIGRRLGREANRYKVAKLFEFEVTDNTFRWQRNQRRIADEAHLDGISIVRTSLPDLPATAAVEAYKSLAVVERAFRSTQSHLRLRPVSVYTTEHVRGHVFLCMLSYYLEWHLRRRLAPLLFEDHDRDAARSRRSTPVAPAQTSPSADRKAATKQTAEGLPVPSFRTLLEDLSSVVLNTVRLPGPAAAQVPIVTQPTPLQHRAFSLLEVNPNQIVPMSVPT